MNSTEILVALKHELAVIDALQIAQSARLLCTDRAARGLMNNAIDHILDMWPGSTNTEVLRAHVHNTDEWRAALAGFRR